MWGVISDMRVVLVGMVKSDLSLHNLHARNFRSLVGAPPLTNAHELDAYSGRSIPCAITVIIIGSGRRQESGLLRIGPCQPAFRARWIARRGSASARQTNGEITMDRFTKERRQAFPFVELLLHLCHTAARERVNTRDGLAFKDADIISLDEWRSARKSTKAKDPVP
jgi:hypothetical protein